MVFIRLTHLIKIRPPGPDGTVPLGSWLVDQMTAPSVVVAKGGVADMIGLLQRAERYSLSLPRRIPSVPRKTYAVLSATACATRAIAQ